MKYDIRIRTLETEDVLPLCESETCGNEGRYSLFIRETESRRYVHEQYLCLEHLRKLGTGIGVFVLRQQKAGKT